MGLAGRHWGYYKWEMRRAAAAPSILRTHAGKDRRTAERRLHLRGSTG